MPLTLVVPRLLPDPALPAPEDLPPLPATADLLTRAVRQGGAERDYHGWLAQAFGYDDAAAAPFAALRLAAEGGEPGERTWICVDPVSLVAGMADVTMAPEPPPLVEDEADALLASLAAHFAADGVTLLRTAPGHWYAGLDASARLAAAPVARVRGEPLASHLPSGEDRDAWLRRASEAEMLLHAHPVNAARERRGALPVNGVWLWGTGRASTPPRAPFAAVWADETCARGLAMASGAAVHAAAGGLDDLVSVLAANDDVLAVVGDADTTADPAAVERDWLAPLRERLDESAAPGVDLVIGLGARVLRLRPRARTWAQRIAFWKRAPGLAQALRELA